MKKEKKIAFPQLNYVFNLPLFVFPRLVRAYNKSPREIDKKTEIYFIEVDIFLNARSSYTLVATSPSLSLFTVLLISLIKQSPVSPHNLHVFLCLASFSIFYLSLLPTMPLACHMYPHACFSSSHSYSLSLSLSLSLFLSLFEHYIPLYFPRCHIIFLQTHRLSYIHRFFYTVLRTHWSQKTQKKLKSSITKQLPDISEQNRFNCLLSSLIAQFNLVYLASVR